jgi:hypothetical protein
MLNKPTSVFLPLQRAIGALTVALGLQIIYKVLSFRTGQEKDFTFFYKFNTSHKNLNS